MTSSAPIPPIDLAVDTGASPETAWRAVTDPARIAEWFTDATELGPVGAPYRLDFGDGSIVGGTVLSIDPGHAFSHSWAWEGDDASAVTTVTWTVEPLPAGGSRIRLVHDGWTEAGLDAATRDDHEGYWSGYIEDLAAILSGA